MKLLITGCAGFVGARTVQLALDPGHEVVGLDDYYDIHLKEHRLKSICDHPNFRFLELDIETAGLLDRVFAVRHFDAVINVAARADVRASIEFPHCYMHTNAVATLNLLERMFLQSEKIRDDFQVLTVCGIADAVHGGRAGDSSYFALCGDKCRQSGCAF